MSQGYHFIPDRSSESCSSMSSNNLARAAKHSIGIKRSRVLVNVGVQVEMCVSAYLRGACRCMCSGTPILGLGTGGHVLIGLR